MSDNPETAAHYAAIDETNALQKSIGLLMQEAGLDQFAAVVIFHASGTTGTLINPSYGYADLADHLEQLASDYRRRDAG